MCRIYFVPCALLADDFKGAMFCRLAACDAQNDGYNAVVIANTLSRVGCWTRARRKRDNAIKPPGKDNKRGKAHHALVLIQNLYRVEHQGCQLKTEDRHAHRPRRAKPILDELRAWLDEVLSRIPPSSTTGKALPYLHNEWPKLIGYLNDGRLAIDNNGAKKAIWPFVLGRRSWLFSDSVRSVEASANLYSLTETANGLEPYAYLRYLFAELPTADIVEAIEALLPGNPNANQLNRD